VTPVVSPRDVPPARAVPRTVQGLSLVSLLNDFASDMVYPLLPAFVTGTLGGGALALGALDGAADLVSALLKWISGRLADRPGWRSPLILAGYATAVLVRPLIALAAAAWQVVGLRVVDRVGKGIRTSPRDAMIADVTAPALRGRAFGFHRAADHFGAVLGSLAAWLLLERGADVRGVIAWSALPGVLAFIVLVAVLRVSDAKRGAAVPMDPETASKVHRAPPAGPLFWPPVLALAALALTRLPEALLLLRLQDIGVPIAAIPLLWAALHVVRSAGSYPGGRLADRFGPRAGIAAGALLFGAVAAALGAALEPAAAMALFLVFGLVAGLTESAERSMVARLAPARSGRGFGAYHALTGAAALPAGLFFGTIYQQGGGPLALRISAAATAVAVVGWLIVSSRGQEASAG
jgi:MFS family permease